VFLVSTVMRSPRSRRTVFQCRFIPKALDIIQPYLSSTLSKIRSTLCLYNTPTAQFSTHHCRVWRIPQ
ncbi:hypothetical protein M9458_008902, partial [Cirrhinus mrigala]